MPRRRKNPVILSEDDRGSLEGMIARGHAPARRLTHARILLKADEGENAPGEAWPDVKIAHALWRSAARQSLGCERGSLPRDWRPLSSIANRKTPSPKS
jgi:hypothetical protein